MTINNNNFKNMYTITHLTKDGNIVMNGKNKHNSKT